MCEELNEELAKTGVSAVTKNNKHAQDLWVLYSAAQCMLFAAYLIRRKIGFQVSLSHWDNWDDDPDHHGPSESGTDYLVRLLSPYTKDADMANYFDLIVRTPSVRAWESFLERRANKANTICEK